MCENTDRNKRSRSWVFTWNNPDHEIDLTKVKNKDYIIYQLEQGVEKTPHYQGLVYWKEAKTRSSTMKNLNIPKGAEVQPAKNLERSILYSEKKTGWWFEGIVYDEMPKVGGNPCKPHWSEQLEQPIEQGKRPIGQGSRNDMETIKQMLDDGVPYHEIEQQHFKTCARYSKYFLDYRNRSIQNRCTKPTIKILYGKSGTGKSRWALKNYPNAYNLHCCNGGSSIWFDGYNLEDTIIIDEFYGQIQIDMLLKLLNSYQPFTGQIKGGSTKVVAHTFIITSNSPPNEWYPKNTKFETLNALYRRIWEYGEFIDPQTEKNYTLTHFTPERLCKFMVLENIKNGEVYDYATVWDENFTLKLHRSEVSNTVNLTSSKKINIKKTNDTKKKKRFKIVGGAQDYYKNIITLD